MNIIKQTIVVPVYLNKPGKGFNPADKEPSVCKAIKLPTSIAHKYNNNPQNTKKVIKSFFETRNFT